MIPGIFLTSFIEKGMSMTQYYLGGDVSKGMPTL
jgi:hypothetical protein